MRQHLRLGRLAGVPIGLNLSVLVMFALVVSMTSTATLPTYVKGSSSAAYWAVGTAVGVLFIGSLLAHELAHAVVARRYGVRVDGITLWMLGGVAQLDDEPPTPAADLRIAAAGPATSLALAGGFVALAAMISQVDGPRLLVAGIAWLGGINVVLAVFNLLPAAPLDGGRILRAALWRHSHDRVQASLRADRAGRALGIVMVSLGAAEVLLTNDALSGLWLMLLGWFLAGAAAQEAAATVHQALLAGTSVRDAMTPAPVCLPDYQVIDTAVEHVLGAQHSTYPVVSFDGRLTGLVTTAQLTRVPAAARGDHLIRDITLPRQRVAVAAADEALGTALERAAGRSPIVVLGRDDQVVGLITASDLQHLLQRRALTGSSPE